MEMTMNGSMFMQLFPYNKYEFSRLWTKLRMLTVNNCGSVHIWFAFLTSRILTDDDLITGDTF